MKTPSEEEYVDIARILMTTSIKTKTARVPQSPSLNPQEINTPSPSRGPLFTIDDTPPSQWRKRFLDYKAWMDAKILAPDVDRYRVIEEFCAHMIGVFTEWYCSLGL